jgi:hypothetical protein
MPTKFDVGERVEDKKITSAAALPLSTARSSLETSLSRSCSTAATKRLMSRVTAFAKSQRGNHECRSCELPREFRRACLRPELRKENGTGRGKKSRRSWRLEVRNREVSESKMVGHSIND